LIHAWNAMALVAREAKRIFFAGLVLLAAPGCASLPPPADIAAPIERTVPALPSPPVLPPAGRGLVILDSVSGPARATRVRDSALLCSTTPCAASLPYGTQEVLLESNVDPRRRGVYLIDVTDRPIVLRATLDADLPAGPGRAAGAVLFVSGLGCTTVGALIASHDDGRPNEGLDAAGWTALGVGAAVALLGGVLWSNNAPAHYEGHAIEWNLEPGAVPAGPVPPLP
jgi:hypothetical protein